MAVEDKFANEMLTDDELDGVAGGNSIETFQDGEEIVKRILISEDDVLSDLKVRGSIQYDAKKVE
ncbi:MAG: hypothetical protein IKO74_08745 [Selenomonadaceae bacterium]|nr:hypothetical protein [Selenomonadaceae bacterium]